MDIIWSLGLIILVLVAFNHMAGGRAPNVIRPISQLVSGLISLLVRICLHGVGAIVRLFGGTIKLSGSGKPKISEGEQEQPLGRTPPRWDE